MRIGGISTRVVRISEQPFRKQPFSRPNDMWTPVALNRADTQLGVRNMLQICNGREKPTEGKGRRIQEDVRSLLT